MGGPRLELAAAARADEETGTAWVLAWCPLRTARELRALYRCVEAQGLVDLFVFQREGLGRLSQRWMYFLVCADLARASEELGLSTDPFPRFYRYR